MLAAAQARSRSLGHEAILSLGDAMALDFADASFDTVVFCLVLCTVPDDGVAIRESARVLRTGGRLLAVEHVRSPHALVRLIERMWEPFAVREGDHVLRDPVDHLASAGFAIETLERSRLGIVERLVARRLPATCSNLGPTRPLEGVRMPALRGVGGASAPGVVAQLLRRR